MSTDTVSTDRAIAAEHANGAWWDVFTVSRVSGGTFRITLHGADGPIHYVRVTDGVAEILCHESHVACHAYTA